MGFLDRLMGRIGGGDPLNNCPYCGSTLVGWECLSCDVEFVLENDQLVERMLSSRVSSSDDDTCMSCQSSLSRGERFLPWEEGSNPHAYIVCPSCGFENVRYGLGGDD